MMSVRAAEPDRDAADCAAIYGHYIENTVATFELSAPSATSMAARIAASITDFGWLVACDHDGRVLGFAYGTHYNERPAYRWASLVSIYLHPDATGRGLGPALYDALFEHLRSRGIVTACALVAQPNPASMTLHERFGFEQVGYLAGIGFKHGRWIDVALLQRDLAPRPQRPA